MTPHTGIRNSLAWLVTAAIVPIIAYSVWMAWTFICERRAATEAELDGTARALMVAVDRELDSQLKAMDMLGTAHSLDTSDFGKFADRARRALERRPEWLDIVLVDPRSHAIVAGALSIPVPAPTSSAPAAVDKVVATGKPLIVGAFAKGKIIGRPKILLMAPIIRNSDVLFVMTVVLDPVVFNSIFNEQRLPPSWTGAVIDGALRIAGRSRSAELYVGNSVTSLLAQRISNAESGMFEGVNQEGDTVYTVFNRSPSTGWSVGLGVPAEELDRPMRHMVLVIAAAGVALIVLAVGLAVLVGRGIIARRQAYESAIKESEERYRLLIEGAANYAIFYVGPNGLVETWNTAAERMKGYKPEEIIGRHISCFYPDEDVSAGLPDRVLAEARRDGRCEQSGWRVRKDGSRFWADITVTSLYDDTGAFRGFAKVTRDRTDHMRAEAAQKASDERMRLFFERQSVAMAITSPEKGWIQVNDRLCKMLGYSRDELVRLTWVEMTHPDDLAGDQAQFDRLLAGEIDAYSLDKRFIRKDGAVIHTELSVGCVRRQDGSIDYVLAVLADITDRKEAERLLARESMRYQRLLKTASDGIHLVDPDGLLLEANEAFLRMLGYDNKVVGTLRVPDWDVSDSWDEVIKPRIRELIRHRGTMVFETCHRRRDGEILNVEISASGIEIDGNGYLYASSRDITERKRLEDALRAVTTRLKHVLDTTAEGIIGIDDHHRVVLANPAAVEILGWPSAETMEGKSSGDAFGHVLADGSPCAAGNCAIRLAVDKGLTQRVSDEFFVNATTGQRVPVEFVVSPLGTGSDLGGAVIAFHDISDRKALELRLRTINAELEQFAYVASHDMRQPLRMVTSYLSLIEKRLPPETLTEDIKSFLGFAVGGAKRMDGLITGLLEYSRTGRTAKSAPVPLGKAVDDALTNLTVAIREAGAEIVVADNLPTINGDATELIRLFQNLIGNAVKYRAPERRPRIEVGCRRQGREWLISISDNGIGIAADDRERAFAIFQRLVAQDAYEGTGIGLAVCKKIVEHHGGRIWIESEVGVGSTFLIALPKARLDGGTGIE